MASEAPSSTFKRLQNKKSLRNQEVNPGPHGSEAPVPPTERKHSASCHPHGSYGFFFYRQQGRHPICDQKAALASLKDSLICIHCSAILWSPPPAILSLLPPCSSPGPAFFSPCSPFRLLIPVFHANRNGRIRAGGSAQHGRPIPCSTVSPLQPALATGIVSICVRMRCAVHAQGLPHRRGMHVGGAGQYRSQETLRCYSY